MEFNEPVNTLNIVRGCVFETINEKGDVITSPNFRDFESIFDSIKKGDVIVLSNGQKFTVLSNDISRKLICFLAPPGNVHQHLYIHYADVPRINDGPTYIESVSVNEACYKYVDYTVRLHIKLRPVLEELLTRDNQLKEQIDLLIQQREDDRKRIETLESDYKQLLTNMSTITEYMKRTNKLEQTHRQVRRTACTIRRKNG